MKNLLAISLTPAARKQLKTITKTVMPNFGRVRIKANEVILRKRRFSRRSNRIPLMHFLTETLPKEINRWAEFEDIESPLSYFGNSVEFLLHLDAINERNVISYLWKCYTRVITLKDLGVQSVERVRSAHTVSTRITTPVVSDKVLKELKRMRSNVKRTIKLEGLRYSPLNVVYRSPDIRGSPELRTYLATA